MLKQTIRVGCQWQMGKKKNEIQVWTLRSNWPKLADAMVCEVLYENQEHIVSINRLLSFTPSTGIPTLGLQKSDVNLDTGTLVVRHSLAQVYGRGLILGEPKSQKSRRELALPPFTVNVLNNI